MKAKITDKEIESIDKVWHELTFSLQKISEELWKDKLAGISTIEISILSIIERKPNVILKEITERLGIPGSTLTSAIDRLEKRGLLNRIISERDRRSYGLELTEKGKIVQEEHRESERILWKKVLGSYETAEERRDFTRLLHILANNINGSELEADKDGK